MWTLANSCLQDSVQSSFFKVLKTIFDSPANVGDLLSTRWRIFSWEAPPILGAAGLLSKAQERYFLRSCQVLSLKSWPSERPYFS